MIFPAIFVPSELFTYNCDMKIVPGLFFRILKMCYPFLLIFCLLLMSSCSSSGRIGKGKQGQVPCPCEKENKRR